jgi:hypothetical protein
MRTGITHTWLVLLAAGALLLPAAASAQTPQTIVVDGVNDFHISNLIDADGGDVFVDHPSLDIGDCYLTNDAVNLYFGFEHDNVSGWGDIQFGIAVDVNTAQGGILDPWGRKIEWSLSGTLPDFIMYVNVDNGWQDLRVWNETGGTWDSQVAGYGALGWETGTTFKELAVLLSTFGVSAGDPINVEYWLTQGTTNKGPLDAMINDDSQLSTAGGTTWETTVDIPMLFYYPYTIQAAADPDPPVVSGALHLVDSQVRVSFNEPVDQTTAEVAGNYAVTGATVTGAARDATNLNVVHLTLSADIGPSASLYQVTVSNVEDLAGNPVTENGDDNVACFAVKNVLFRGRMGPFLGGQTPPYGGFTVEGSPAPLTWGLCDNMAAVDVGDDVYEVDADFCFAGDCAGGTATASIEWKWVYDCSVYEPLASNRTHTLDVSTGANDVIDVWWNDQDPTQFTAHDIDVLFYVDCGDVGLAPGDSVSINGQRLPLNWNIPPELQMVDDGTGIDDVAGDDIYSLLVTFPAGTEKYCNYKFVHNSTYECLTQGDRNVYLNDELFDVVGGALGPLTLPVVHFDACDVIWRGVEVVFSVDVNDQLGDIGGGDVVAVNGTPSNSETPSFSWDVPSLNPMADDGVAPDAASGDGIYTVSVVFEDSSQIYTEYKYLVNDAYEGGDQANRSFTIDADNYDDAGNPQVLPTDNLHQCNTVDAGDLPGRLALAQNHPNPFNPKTEIRFTVHRAGHGALQVFNVKGELVRTLLRGHLATGPHAVSWDGLDEAGRQSPTGVYFYRLSLNGESDVRKMMLVK